MNPMTKERNFHLYLFLTLRQRAKFDAKFRLLSSSWEKRMFTLCNLSILPLIKTKCLCRKEVWQVTHEPEWTAFNKNSQLCSKDNAVKMIRMQPISLEISKKIWRSQYLLCTYYWSFRGGGGGHITFPKTRQ